MSVLYLIDLAGITEGFFHERGRPAVSEDLFRKLKIEKSSGKIPAPDFILADLNEKRVRLVELKGKVVLLNFWATWCPPCIQEMPAMERVHREFGKKGLAIVAINFREAPAQVREFFKTHKLTFTALLDHEGKVFELYQAWALPMSVIINKRGELVGKVRGYRDWHSDAAKEFFSRLLEERQ